MALQVHPNLSSCVALDISENVLSCIQNPGMITCCRMVGDGECVQRCHWHGVDEGFRPRCIPHIVPPTWNKWVGDFTLHHIWRQAYPVLRQTEQVFVVGTSLQEADSHLRYLLTTALSTRACADAPAIYVINKIDASNRAIYLERMRTAVQQRIDQNGGACLWVALEEPTIADCIMERLRGSSIC